MRIDAWRAAALGAIFAAIVTLPGLGNGTLWDNSETVYGEVAREILLTHDWVVMHLNGDPWFVQPPLYFWIGALFAKVLGVSGFAMRLPAALATIGMNAAIAYATARVAGMRAGIVASLILATSLMQAIVGRLAIMDALLDACIAVALVCWARAFAPPVRFEATRSRSPAFVAGSVALALGVLAKGPVAPAIVVLVIGVWLIWQWRSGADIGVPPFRAWLAGIVLAAGIVAPWFVLELMRVGPGAAGELIGHYTVGRFTGVIENQTGPFWYYVPVLILGFFPWIAFVPAGALRVLDAARDRDGSFERFALAWAIVPLVFFSCAQTKLPNYIALMLPALAIVVALWFERIADGRDRRAGIISAAFIPAFVALLGIAIVLFIRSNKLDATISVIGPQAAVLGAVMLVGSILTVAAIANARRAPLAPYALGLTVSAFILFIAFVAEPAAEAFKPIPGFAQTILARRGAASIVAVHDAPGAYALMFYTAPVVHTLDDGPTAFDALICPRTDVYLVTQTKLAAALESAARQRGRRAEELGATPRETLIHIDGPTCVTRGEPENAS